MINLINNKEHVRHHYIEDPKAYISGMATHPEYLADDDSSGETDIEMPGLTSDSSDGEDELWNYINNNDENKYTLPTHARNNTRESVKLINHIRSRKEAGFTDVSSSEEPSEEDQDFFGYDYGARIYVKEEKEKPPNLGGRIAVGTYNEKDKTFTNCYVSKVGDSNRKEKRLEDYEIVNIPTPQSGIIRNVFSNCKYEIVEEKSDEYEYKQQYSNNNNKNNKNNNNNYDEDDECEDVWYPGVKHIREDDDQWFINVPIRYEDGNVRKTRVFADPGANAACIDAKWAYENFGNSICENRTKIVIQTPGGNVYPKECIWMTFPTVNNKMLKAKLYLIKYLDKRIKILADINMLKAFGYEFKEETPPVFHHREKQDLDMEMKEDDEFLSNRSNINTAIVKKKSNNVNKRKFNNNNHNYHSNWKDRQYNWFEKRTQGRRYCMFNNRKEKFDYNYNLSMYDILQSDGLSIYQSNDKNEFEENELMEQEILHCYHLNEIRENQNFEIKDVNLKLVDVRKPPQLVEEKVDCEYEYEMDTHIQGVRSMLAVINQEKEKDEYNDKKYDYKNKFNFAGQTIHSLPIYHKLDRHGNSYKDSVIYHRCLFIQSRESFRATADEIAKADAIREEKDEFLKFINFAYLISYEKKYGKKYKGLYQMIVNWVNNNRDIFAKRTFSRRTMRVPYARLGIKPEHRDKSMYAPQYPISAEKRIHMINYTIKNERNGFWKKIKYSLNCVPYTMVPKKKNGQIVRFRPAFDGRVVNQYCRLMTCTMPTLKDFRELHSIKGLVTMLDIKNMFDCIPLHPDDRKFAVAHTPLGLYQMNCLTYGWMNAAPEAQKIMNRVALYIGDCLAYIDDVCVKHKIDDGTRGIERKLNRIAEIVRRLNIQLNPTKFVPCCDYSESFGFQHSMIGEMISKAYQKKILAIKRPTSKAEVRSLDGMLNYVNNHIYNNKLFTYWWKQIEEGTNANNKKRFIWTREAEFAFQAILYLAANPPLLRYPTREGLFCLQTDACNYGLGAVLWQLQDNEEEDTKQWVIVDMWSKVVPVQLRHCHPMIHEALAVASAIEHWQFYLIKKHFIVSTDNLPIANIFGKCWKVLNPITQKQLLRLRTKVGSFNFTSHHVKGLNNPIADGLSRHMIKLIKEEEKLPIEERKLPLTLEAIRSVDTKTRSLTEKEKLIRRQALEESERLVTEMERLKNEKVEFIEQDLVVNNINIIPLTDEENRFYSKTERLTKFQQYRMERDKSWNDLMCNYKNNCNYLYKNNIKEYIEETDELLDIVDTDLKDPLFDEMRRDLNTITTTITNMSSELRNEINELFLKEEMHQRQEQFAVMQIVKKQEQRKEQKRHHLYANDEKYNPLDDVDSDDPELQIVQEEGPVTRSKTRKQREPRRKRVATREQTPNSNDDDDTIEDFGEVSFNQERQKYRSREEFIREVFGHRNDSDLFNMKKFRRLQFGDNILKLVRKLITTDKSKWSMTDIDLMKEQDNKLYQSLLRDEVFLNDEILEIEIFDNNKNDTMRKLLVPFHIRGKLMDYAHHNLQAQHVNYDQTMFNLKHYYWTSMKKDVRYLCKHCVPCQFSKGRARRKTPLALRKLEAPLNHLYCDFAGSFLGDKYFLVMVCAATGYVVIVPTEGCDALVVINAILTKWVPIFGWFKKFESDWGSGFNSRLVKTLNRLTGATVELAEPRNHRSIGKVERVIGIIQDIIQRYNIILKNKFTNRADKYDESWRTIEIIGKLIQLAMNQRRRRFSHYSPNMLIFGRNMNDLSDISRMETRLNEIYNDNERDISKNDFRYLSHLIENLKIIRKHFTNDWMKYAWFERNSFNKKHGITPVKVERNLSKIPPGTQVLYYIGDRQVAMAKWRHRWTGPWMVEKHINDTTIIITDPHSGSQKRVTIDRIKKYNPIAYESYESVIGDKDYLEYQKKLLQDMKNYGVKFREGDFELDFTIAPTNYAYHNNANKS